ncbi:MAG: hypothetical protein ACP5QO_16955, partial [Clostridia bacterium]
TVVVVTRWGSPSLSAVAAWFGDALAGGAEGVAAALGVLAAAVATLLLTVLLTAAGAWLLGSPEWYVVLRGVERHGALGGSPFIPWVLVALGYLWGGLLLFVTLLLPVLEALVWGLVGWAILAGMVGGPALVAGVAVGGGLALVRGAAADALEVESGPRVAARLVGRGLVTVGEAVALGVGWSAPALVRLLPLAVNGGLLLLMGVPFAILVGVALWAAGRV